MKRSNLAVAAMAALGLSACASTPVQTGSTGGRPPVATAPSSSATKTTQPVGFSAREIEIIRDYYRNQSSGKHPGKGNKGLPPGIAKNLARGKPLPPGIAKRGLPSDLVRALPPCRDGYERVVIDGRVILVEVATQVVRDVLYDVVMG